MEETTSTQGSSAPEVSQSSTSSATQSATSPSETPNTASSTQAAQGQENAATSQSEAYTPSYKFKVLDKEQEFDEWLRPVVKSKEQETKLKELYEKAYGLDHVKQGRDQLKQEYTQYKEQWTPVIQNLSEAAKFRQRAVQSFQSGDQKAAVFHYDTMLKHLGLTDKEMQQYVFQKLQLEDLPEDAKQEYNRRRDLELNQMAYQERLSQMEQQNISLLKQQKTFELNTALSKPEVASVKQAFDQRNGEQAFMEEVINTGYLMSQRLGHEVSADEAIQTVLKKYGPAYQAQAPQVQSNVQGQSDVPIIPAVKGGGASPAMKSPKSLDDLKNIRKEKFGY